MPTTTQTLQKGRFSIEQELSTTGSCTHFQAYDTEGEEAVSIFEIIPQLPKVATVSQRESLEAAFTSKAKTVSLLKQKALPAVLGSFTDGGRYYVVTDCVTGTDLFSVANDREKAFSTDQLAEWADSLLETLNTLHISRPSIVYRNLHPENVILGQDGSVTLSISGLFHNSEPTLTPSGNETSAGSAIAFSPLEQIWSGLDAASQKVIINQYDESSERVLKQDLDARSDIYSLGATLYFLATGRTPVDALERSIEMIEGNPDPLTAPNKLDQSVPAEVSDVIMKAMEIKREYRFDSAAIMRQVLRTALVRVKERGAAPASNPSVPVTRPRPETAGNGQVKTPAADDVAKRLLEAEEKRLEAERRAAEAEKRLREAEEAQARLTESFNVSQLDDDVLGLLTSNPPHSSDASNADLAPAFSPAEAAAAKDDLDVNAIFDRAVTEVVEKEKNDGLQDPEPVVERPLTTASKATASANAVPSSFETARASIIEDVLETGFDDQSGTTKSSFPFGVPMLAAAAAVVVIAAIGGWMMFSGGSAPDAATTIQAQPSVDQERSAEPPVQNAYQPSETPQTTSEISTETLPAGDQTAVTQPEKTAPAKAKKAAPARTPAPKKAVTVDDLINDN